MKLVVDRSTKERQAKTGFLGRGPEQIETSFGIRVQLKDVDQSTIKMLNLYTYVTTQNTRRPYIKLPIHVLSEREEYHKQYVTIEELLEGTTWTFDYLDKEFASIPYTIKTRTEEILTDIALGKLWNEMPEEEIEIETKSRRP